MLQLLETYFGTYNGKFRHFRVVEIVNANTVRVELLNSVSEPIGQFRCFTVSKIVGLSKNIV